MSTSSIGALPSLSSEAFLKLFITQLQHQDPTEPADATKMLSDLAQLTSVQKLDQMSTDFAKALKLERVGLARQLIGQTITAKVNDAPVSGVVDEVAAQDGVIGVKISGLFVPLDSVETIRPTLAEAPPPA